jgi:hypothetical protein
MAAELVPRGSLGERVHPAEGRVGAGCECQRLRPSGRALGTRGRPRVEQAFCLGVGYVGQAAPFVHLDWGYLYRFAAEE